MSIVYFPIKICIEYLVKHSFSHLKTWPFGRFVEVEGATILVQKFERQANAGDRVFSIDGFLVNQWLVTVGWPETSNFFSGKRMKKGQFRSHTRGCCGYFPR